MKPITIRENLVQSGPAKIVRAALIATLVVTVLVLAFTWPTKTSEVKDLPISISGSAEMVETVKSTLEEKSPGTFDFVEADSRDEAVSQIEERQTYGAIILSDGAAPEVLTASAASSATNNLLNNLATQLTAQSQAAAAQAQQSALETGIAEGQAGITELQTQLETAQKAVEEGGESAEQAKAMVEALTPKLAEAQTKIAGAQAQLEALKTQAQVKEATTASVTDVVKLSEDDSTGAGLTVAAFPLVIGGMIGGIMMLTLVQGVFARLAANTLYGVLSGLVLPLVLSTWFGFVQGNFGLLWLAFALTNMATGFFIIGVASLLGKLAGVGLGVLTTMLIGNGISGASSPWEFLLQPWGAIGQHMVPGASARLLRSISYFPDAATSAQWLTLLAWIAGGAVLALAGFALAKKNKGKLDAAPATHAQVEAV